MPFGLKNAPQVYQRLIDNAFNGYLKIGSDHESIEAGSAKLIDVFIEGEPETDPRPSVLGQRSYIDDILIRATSWALFTRKLKDCWKCVISGTYRSAWLNVFGDVVK